jgi:group I intron endonuclease
VNGYRPKPITGIYKIKNKTNATCYIGQSKNIFRRWNDHTNLLLSGKHPNLKLQGDFALSDLQNFEFEILETCKDKFLLQKEKFYINKTVIEGGKLYNIL